MCEMTHIYKLLMLLWPEATAASLLTQLYGKKERKHMSLSHFSLLSLNIYFFCQYIKVSFSILLVVSYKHCFIINRRRKNRQKNLINKYAFSVSQNSLFSMNITNFYHEKRSKSLWERTKNLKIHNK